MTMAVVKPNWKLTELGIKGHAHLDYNVLETILLQPTLECCEEELEPAGTVPVATNAFTERSCNDKFVLCEYLMDEPTFRAVQIALMVAALIVGTLQLWR